jgi:hypothetical protein
LRINDSINVTKKIERDHKKDLFRKVEQFENEAYRDEYYKKEDVYTMVKEIDQDDYDNDELEAESDFDYYGRPNSKNSNRKIKKQSRLTFLNILWTLILVSFIVICLLTFVFNNANIYIEPKNIEQNISISLNMKNTVEKSTYDMVEIKKEALKTVEKSGVKKVVSKAGGEITIYNNFNNNIQKLVKNTRFESADGKIFRIVDSVTVPAKVGNTQGSVNAKVTADSVGEGYNISVGKFTIPGFKGSPRYNAFYAESKKPMSGGANSEKTFFSSSDIETSKMEMQAELRTSILKDVSLVKKDNYINAENLLNIKYEDNIKNLESGLEDKLKVTAIAKVILINKNELTKNIATSVYKDYKNENISFSEKNNLTFSFASGSSKIVEDNIDFVVSGDLSAVFDTDTDAVSKSLASKENNQNNFNDIMSNFTNVKSATTKIFPPWSNTFPSNYKKINIILK